MFKLKRAQPDGAGQEAPGDIQTAKSVDEAAVSPHAKAGPGAAVLKSKVPPALTPKRRQTEPPDGATIREQFEAVRRYAAEPRAGVGFEPRRSHTEEPSRLLIGRDITFKGQIGQCQTLVVEGNVTASAKCSSLQVQEAGFYDGDIEAETAEICGRVAGRIRVRGRLTIRTAGDVSGEVTYGELDIAAGGRLAGKIVHEPVTQEAAPEESAAARAAAPQAAPAAVAPVDNTPSTLPDPSDIGPQENPFQPIVTQNGNAEEAIDSADRPASGRKSIPMAVGAAGARP